MVFIMLPFFFVAMFEKDGFTAEKWLYHIIRQKFLRSGIRTYKTENLYEWLQERENIEQEVKRLESKRKGKNADGKEKKNLSA